MRSNRRTPRRARRHAAALTAFAAWLTTLPCAAANTGAAFVRQTPHRGLTEAQLRAECVELITGAELASLGRKHVLTRVEAELPGSSVCGWEDPQDESRMFIVTRQTAAWFKYGHTSGPKEYFDNRREADDAVDGTEPVPGLGLEARLQKRTVMPTLMVRRDKDVVFVMCSDCSRDQLIALAKAAAH